MHTHAHEQVSFRGISSPWLPRQLSEAIMEASWGSTWRNDWGRGGRGGAGEEGWSWDDHQWASGTGGGGTNTPPGGQQGPGGAAGGQQGQPPQQHQQQQFKGNRYPYYDDYLDVGDGYSGHLGAGGRGAAGGG